MQRFKLVLILIGCATVILSGGYWFMMKTKKISEQLAQTPRPRYLSDLEFTYYKYFWDSPPSDEALRKLREQHENLRILKVRIVGNAEAYPPGFDSGTAEFLDYYEKITERRYGYFATLELLTPITEAPGEKTIPIFYFDHELIKHRGNIFVDYPDYQDVSNNRNKEYYVLFTGEYISTNFIHAGNKDLDKFIGADKVNRPGYILIGLALPLSEKEAYIANQKKRYGF